MSAKRPFLEPSSPKSDRPVSRDGASAWAFGMDVLRWMGLVSRDVRAADPLDELALNPESPDEESFHPLA